MRPHPLRVVVCLLWLAVALPCQPANVLILLADDVGVDSVGVYAEGGGPPPTPSIDALAAGGVLFRNAWANPVCSPTRACIHTGRYALRTGVGHAIFPTHPGTPPSAVLSLAETTLPELLDAQRSGYAHAAIGKWHLGDSTNGGALGPNLAGWSHFAGVVFGAGWDYYSWDRTVNGVTALSTAYHTTQTVDDALAWIQSAPEPWVCHVAFLAAHWPLHAPPPALHTQNLQGLSPGQTPRPFYKAMVEAMDTEIGRLLSSLGPALRSRTNVIFLGDNGTPRNVTQPPFVPSHAKSSPYEGGINVPLIVSGPAVGAPGREESALVGAVDLFATVADLCGVDPAVPFVKVDGVSFTRHLQAPGRTPVRSTVYAEWFSTTDPGFAAVRDARYKLIRFFNPPRDELYDLAADPFELSDLLRGQLSAQQQAAYAALGAEIVAVRNTAGSLSRYGATGCVGSNGNPTIGWSGTPVIGTSYTITLRNAARSQPAVLFFGASRSRWGALSLPFPLTGPSCFLYASGEVRYQTLTDGSGNAAIQLPLPNLPTLVAAPLYHCWLIHDPMAPSNPEGLTGSDGAIATVGKPAT